MPLALPSDPLAATVVAPRLLTREIFGNIPPWAQWLFYLAALLAVALWVYGVARRVRLWRRGRRGDAPIALGAAATRLLRDVIFQRRLWGHRARGRGWASSAHVLLFGGFFVLLIGTTLVCIEHVLADLLGRESTDPVFHKGVYFGVYELVMDAFGVAFLIGCAMFLIRRLRSGGSFARNPADVGILVLLIAIGVTGYIVEGLRIILAATPLPGLSPVGYAIARLLGQAGLDSGGAAAGHLVLWWVHAVLALGFIAIMPFTRLMHAIAGTVNLVIRDHSLARMHPISLAEVEETGQIGVATLGDFSYRQLIELDACVSCGRCQDACPAYEAGKPLSPRNVIQDLVHVMELKGTGGATSAEVNESGARGLSARRLPGGVIADETLWSCTTCGACAYVCPLGISPMRMITDMRRNLIGEGALRGSPATALQKTERAGNPWGLSPSDRMGWASGLDVPLVSEHPDFEILYWVGCAAAYDRRVQKVARSVVRLLQAANVNFAVLGPEERCTGESARRMGDELLFGQLAEQNVETLSRRGVRRIVAHCPHCVNSLRHDYPHAGGQYEVIHHSELLAELVQQGRLPTIALNDGDSSAMTYHDPCYLARANGITEPPRAVLAAARGGAESLTIVELPRNKSQTSCCGGGGGRMWFDDAVAQRVGQGRIHEIAASGAQTVAVSCPFCLIMLGDGLAAESPEMRVRDIAEVLASAALGPEISPASPSLEGRG